MNGLLSGQVALVTGGATGIGSTALAMAREGAKVVVADVQEAGARQTMAMIHECGGEALFVKCDVAKIADVRNLIETSVNTFGRIDCAFNNAGILGPLGPIVDRTEEEWDRVMGVNLKGVWLCMKYQIPQMLKQGKGAIVNVSSISGKVALSGFGVYAASKHGVIGLTRTAAIEYAKFGIRVNAVCPGVIETPLLDEVVGSAGPAAEAQFVAAQPIGRKGKPEEIAEAVVWLCSDRASLVTGEAMSVDGGWTAQ